MGDIKFTSWAPLIWSSQPRVSSSIPWRTFRLCSPLAIAWMSPLVSSVLTHINLHSTGPPVILDTRPWWYVRVKVRLLWWDTIDYSWLLACKGTREVSLQQPASCLGSGSFDLLCKTSDSAFRKLASSPPWLDICPYVHILDLAGNIAGNVEVRDYIFIICIAWGFLLVLKGNVLCSKQPNWA